MDFARPELDACGIGFVADERGRSSRGIVEAALGGLACVKHRGALAADARSADGSGLLVPIPAAIFGEGHGVASLFCRGADPRAAIEAVAAAEGIELIGNHEILLPLLHLAVACGESRQLTTSRP